METIPEELSDYILNYCDYRTLKSLNESNIFNVSRHKRYIHLKTFVEFWDKYNRLRKESSMNQFKRNIFADGARGNLYSLYYDELLWMKKQIKNILRDHEEIESEIIEISNKFADFLESENIDWNCRTYDEEYWSILHNDNKTTNDKLTYSYKIPEKFYFSTINHVYDILG